MTAILTEITPDLASRLLQQHREGGAPERYIDLELISGYAEDMSKGNWANELNDRRHAIEIAGARGWEHNGTYYPPGTIIDGFHRLSAVAESGVTIKAWLDIDVDNSTDPERTS